MVQPEIMGASQTMSGTYATNSCDSRQRRQRDTIESQGQFLRVAVDLSMICKLSMKRSSSQCLFYLFASWVDLPRCLQVGSEKTKTNDLSMPALLVLPPLLMILMFYKLSMKR